MMMQTEIRPQRALLAGLALLFSQAALSGGNDAARKPEELRVSAQRPEITVADPRLESDAQALIEAIGRRVAEDLERRIEAIRSARIGLAVSSEFPTRG